MLPFTFKPLIEKRSNTMTIAVIGGSGIYHPVWLSQVTTETVTTPFGAVAVTRGWLSDEHSTSLFINRHGVDHHIPPHRVNYRANIWALKELGADMIVATAAVGSMNQAMAPGTLVLPDQFIDFTKNRESTYFDGGGGLGQGVVHTDMTHPFSSALRRVLVAAAERIDIARPIEGGTYVCTEGPRFETPAEIRAYRLLGGDLVGMTAVPEVVLAGELAMGYQTLALVTNWAAGLTDAGLSHQEVLDLMAANSQRTTRLLTAMLQAGLRERRD
jgi:5'-methylthioadenosine phosphorylase